MDIPIPEAVPPDASHLQSALTSLSARLDVFERNLQAAVESERLFRRSLSAASRALDAFTSAHLAEDLSLTRLVAADTQRSRIAKLDYDALAARFNTALRPPGSASPHPHLLRSVSLYVGIVLSLVFIAPLHLLASLLDKLLARLGFRRSDDPVRGYAQATARYRARQNSRRAEGAARLPTHPLDAAQAADRRHRASPATSLRSTLGSSTSASDLSLTALPDAVPQEDAAWLPRNLLNAASAREEGDFGRYDSAESSDEHDVFLDAVAGAEGMENLGKGGDADAKKGKNGDRSKAKDAEHRREKEVAKRESERKRELRAKDELQRPDWARPFDDDSPPEATKFPSADFWNISDEDLRIDRLKQAEDSASEQP